MATLTWTDVVVIGLVATVGFTLLSFWYSALMTRRDWSYQVRPRRRRDGDAKAPRRSSHEG
jgi:hypothetical protein